MKTAFSLFVVSVGFASLANAGSVRLSDEISQSSVARVVAKVAELSKRGDRNITVELNSTGGDLHAALRGYKQLRAYGVNTYVRNECSSSCTVLFAAGRRRSASTSSEFMFHAVKVRAVPGERVSRRELERIARQYASSWLEVVRSVAPSLASELHRNRVLIDGERSYSGYELRRSGYVND